MQFLILTCKNTQRVGVNERFGVIVEKLVGVKSILLGAMPLA